MTHRFVTSDPTVSASITTGRTFANVPSDMSPSEVTVSMSTSVMTSPILVTQMLNVLTLMAAMNVNAKLVSKVMASSHVTISMSVMTSPIVQKRLSVRILKEVIHVNATPVTMEVVSSVRIETNVLF